MGSNQFLPIVPSFVNPEPLLFLSKESKFYTDMVEFPLQGSSGALHHCASCSCDADIFWNIDGLIS